MTCKKKGLYTEMVLDNLRCIRTFYIYKLSVYRKNKYKGCIFFGIDDKNRPGGSVDLLI